MLVFEEFILALLLDFVRSLGQLPGREERERWRESESGSDDDGEEQGTKMEEEEEKEKEERREVVKMRWKMEEKEDRMWKK